MTQVVEFSFSSGVSPAHDVGEWITPTMIFLMKELDKLRISASYIPL